MRLMFVIVCLALWEHQIQIAPVFGGSRALAGPIRVVIQVIGHLCRPEARDVAIVNIAFHRLAKSGCAAGRIDLPPR